MDERLDDVENFVEEGHRVEHVDGFQLGRKPVLQVVEELADCADLDAQQVGQTHVAHVEQADEPGSRTVGGEARLQQHKVRLDGFVKAVVGRLGTAQPVVHHGITRRSRRKWKVVSADER